ncbi:MAG: hypothetical protein V1689_07580 [Pseudomonadota bacterium]
MKSRVIVTALMALLALGTPGKGRAYIMTADQLIGLMTGNFSKFKTLVITQSTQVIDTKDQEIGMALEEKVWLRSPDYYRLELLGVPGLIRPSGTEKPVLGEVVAGRESSEMAFRRLLIKNDSQSIKALLSRMGVNLDSVAFTRLDGVIAYRVGDGAVESPKLLIEKDRFLPLLLNYRSPERSGGKMVKVRYDDYRKVEGGWYPFKITCSIGEETLEHYFVLDLQINVPVNP